MTEPETADPTAPPAPAPGRDIGADLLAALSFTGAALLRNAAAYLLSVLVMIGVAAVAAALGALAFGALSFSDLPVEATVIAMFVPSLLAGIALLVWQAGVAVSAVSVAAGRRPRLREVLAGPIRVSGTILLTAVLIALGTLLFVIPGILAGIAFLLAVPASARGAEPFEALAESVRLVRGHLGTAVIGFVLSAVVIGAAGSAMVTVPLGTLVTTVFLFALHERLSGRELPEPARA